MPSAAARATSVLPSQMTDHPREQHGRRAGPAPVERVEHRAHRVGALGLDAQQDAVAELGEHLVEQRRVQPVGPAAAEDRRGVDVELLPRHRRVVGDVAGGGGHAVHGAVVHDAETAVGERRHVLLDDRQALADGDAVALHRVLGHVQGPAAVGDDEGPAQVGEVHDRPYVRA
jgi:hypothetical protein